MQTMNEGRKRRNTEKLFRNILKMFAPPPELTISEWADRYRVLAMEDSAEAGRWRTDRAPYQQEMMDAISDSKVEMVVFKTSSQIGKTAMLLNVIGYHIDYDPAPMLYIMPNVNMAESFSKDRLAPMIRECPSLKRKVKPAKSRDSGNTILHKRFTSGHLTLIGANAPAELSARPIRIILLDEIDRFPASAGTEGDPMQLAIKRTNNFWNRKIVAVSTPTIKGVSKIDAEYESSSAEELHIACPNCGAYQPYEWAQLKFSHVSGTMEFEVLGYECKHCGVLGKEYAWKRQPMKWVAKYPNITKKRGFHLNELASPWRKWEDIVRDFLTAKRQGREMLKVWHNTVLGLSWEEEGDLNIEELLLKRREYYNCQVPLEVLVLTAGVDVQDNRLEYEVIGWGLEKSSWGIQYGVIMGDPGLRETWAQLDDVLFRNYLREDDLQMQIMTTCIDSGGHYTSEVYAYCRKHEARRVWAIKGQGGSGVPFVQRPNKRNQSGAWLFRLGVDVGKDTISSRLKVKFETEAGFCHFPMEEARGYNEQYFEGLTAERRQIRTVNGQMKINWVLRASGARNEPFDIRNYATAALEILNPNLERLYERQNKHIEKELTLKRSRGSKGVEIWKEE